jgi:hypothetical protein
MQSVPLLAETHFQHDPLVQCATAIRLIQVLPELADGMIQCVIKPASIDATYTALSYVWRSGGSEDMKTIRINSQPFRIHKNLFDFLSHAREKYHDLDLWIDALCI